MNAESYMVHTARLSSHNVSWGESVPEIGVGSEQTEVTDEASETHEVNTSGKPTGHGPY